MSTPIPIITTQTVNTKQGVPFAYSLSGTNISNTTNFSVVNSNFPVTINQVKRSGANPRLIFTPIVYGSGATANSNGAFIPNTISIRAWNSTEVDINNQPLDQARGTIYVNTLPQKPIITPGQLVTARDEEGLPGPAGFYGNPDAKFFIKGKNVGENYSDKTFPGTQWTGTKLPSGLFLNQSGFISGIPTQIGSFTATFRASNPSGTSAPVQVSIRVLPQPPKIEVNGLIYSVDSSFTPNIQILATQNESITSLQIKSISKVPVTWTATNLPKGVVLSPKGVLSGKPTVYPTNGRITSTATVKNSGGSLSINIYFTIKPAPVILSTVFTIIEETAFNFRILATYSPTSYTATLISNGVAKPLPTWAVLNKNTGTFTGTPPLISNGLYIFRVTVTTSQGTKSSKDISVTVKSVELSLGSGTFTGLISSVSGVAELRTIYSRVSVALDQIIPGNGTLSPNLGKQGDTGETIFTLGARYYIQGNPVTNCPPGNGIIKHPGKMIYHAYGTAFGTSYNPGERKGILIVPGKTFRQLGFSQGIYNLIATWVPSRCARAVGWKVTYSYPLQMWVN
jgi:hypothetical protein